MQSALIVSAGAWMLLAMFVISLAIYRKVISRGEFDVVHVRDVEASLIPGQVTLSQRLDRIDRWGKSLTVVIVIFGLAIAAAFLLRAWQQSAALGG